MGWGILVKIGLVMLLCFVSVLILFQIALTHKHHGIVTNIRGSHPHLSKSLLVNSTSWRTQPAPESPHLQLGRTPPSTTLPLYTSNPLSPVLSTPSFSSRTATPSVTSRRASVGKCTGRNLVDHTCTYANICWDGESLFVPGNGTSITQNLGEGWGNWRKGLLSLSKNRLVKVESRKSKFAPIQTVPGVTLLMWIGYDNYFFTYARLISAYEAAFRHFGSLLDAQINVVTLGGKRSAPGEVSSLKTVKIELFEALVNGSPKKGMVAALNDLKDVCFESGIMGNSRLFPSFVGRTFLARCNLEPVNMLLPSIQLPTRELRARVLKGLGLQQREDEGRIRTLFVNRLAKRRIVNQDDVVAVLDAHGLNTTTTHFDKATLARQAEQVSQATVLVGMHGAGMGNMFWLPPRATVIEVFPHNFSKSTYRVYAELLQLRYFGYENPFESLSFETKFTTPYPKGSYSYFRNQDTAINITDFATVLRDAVDAAASPFPRPLPPSVASTLEASTLKSEIELDTISSTVAPGKDHNHFSQPVVRAIDSKLRLMQNLWPTLASNESDIHDMDGEGNCTGCTAGYMSRKGAYSRGHRYTLEHLTCPGSVRGKVPNNKECKRTQGYCYQQPPLNVLSGRNLCLKGRAALANTSHPMADARFSIHYDFHMAEYRQNVGKENSVEISIATQCDLERCKKRLPMIADVWQGPLVSAILLQSIDQADQVRDMIQGSENVQRWVDVHLVVCGEGEVDKAGFLYPVNVLRNVASQLVLTKWTFVIDADILPHARAQVYDLQIAQAYASYLPSRKKRQCECTNLHVFIPPALEYTAMEHMPNMCPNGDVCMSKSEATCWIKKGMLRPMHLHFGFAYLPTNFVRWLHSSEPYEVSYIKQFEPYYIIQTGGPPFSEAFEGRGANFAQQVYELFAAGYSFHVLPEAFVIDIPHGIEERATELPGSVKAFLKFIALANRSYALGPEHRTPSYYASAKFELAMQHKTFLGLLVRSKQWELYNCTQEVATSPSHVVEFYNNVVEHTWRKRSFSDSITTGSI